MTQSKIWKEMLASVAAAALIGVFAADARADIKIGAFGPDDRRCRRLRAKPARGGRPRGQRQERRRRRTGAEDRRRIRRRCRQARTGGERREAPLDQRRSGRDARFDLKPGKLRGLSGRVAIRDRADRHRRNRAAHHDAGQSVGFPLGHTGHEVCRRPRRLHGEEVARQEKGRLHLRQRRLRQGRLRRVQEPRRAARNPDRRGREIHARRPGLREPAQPHPLDRRRFPRRSGRATPKARSSSNRPSRWA